MVVRDTYSLLSSAVRIASSPRLSPQLRLHHLLRDLVRRTGLSSAAVFAAGPDEEGFSLAVSDRIKATPLERTGAPSGIASACAAARALTRIPASDLAPFEAEFLRGDAVFAFPVLEASSLCGVLVLGLRDGERLTPSVRRFIDDLLHVVGGLLRNLGVAEACEERLKMLQTLHDLGQVVNRAPAAADTVTPILQACHERGGACSTILRVTENDLSISPGRFPRARKGCRRFLPLLLELEESAAAEATASGEAVVRCDIAGEEGVPRSLICVPLSYESRVFGSVTFFGKRRGGGGYGNFLGEDRDMFSGIGVLITNALVNAANFARVRSLAEDKRRKLNELGLMHRISNHMLSTMRLNKLISLVLTALTTGDTPFFDRAMLFLTNEKAGNMQGMLGVTRETSGALGDGAGDDADVFRWEADDKEIQRQIESPFGAAVRGTRIPLDRNANVSSRAVIEKRLIHVPDVARHKRVDAEFIARFGISSFAAAPLMAKEKVLGVVVVDNSV
ncbi:MAG TPA: GAF domain-containing protein, partial [Verrucomicrobiae bacterium]|nr:GAF domain-containing protein [Verrucomicrobiae bacterium]